MLLIFTWTMILLILCNLTWYISARHLQKFIQGFFTMVHYDPKSDQGSSYWVLIWILIVRFFPLPKGLLNINSDEANLILHSYCVRSSRQRQIKMLAPIFFLSLVFILFCSSSGASTASSIREGYKVRWKKCRKFYSLLLWKFLSFSRK